MTADRVVVIATPPPSNATAAAEKDVLLPPPPGDGSSASARHPRKTGGPSLFDLPPALSDSRADLSLCGCRGNKAGLSPPPARYIPAVLMSEPPFRTGTDAAPPTRTLGRVTRSLLFYNTGDIDLLFMTLRFLKYLQGRHCVPPTGEPPPPPPRRCRFHAHDWISGSLSPWRLACITPDVSCARTTHPVGSREQSEGHSRV